MQGQVFGGCEDVLITDSALLPGSEDIPVLPSHSQLCQPQKLSLVFKPSHADVLLCYSGR